MIKKIILILFLSIALKAFSIAQIKVKCDVEIGYLNNKYSLNEDGFFVQYKSGDVLYCDIIADFSIKRFHVEQQIFNMFSFDGGHSFKPMEILYKTRLYYKYKSFLGGIEHMCLHPIINQHNTLDLITRRASHDKIFIRFTFEN